MLLSDLPTEILENILFCIDVAQDLLHLALSCKGFSDIIIPDHLDFISIASNIRQGNTAIWRALRTYPSLAKRTLRLYIKHGQPRYPALRYRRGRMHKKRYVADEGLSTNEDKYTLCKSAVRFMANMLHFSLAQAMPVGVIRDILTSISDCCRQLQSLYLKMDHVGLDITEEISPNTLAFPRLTSFIFSPCSDSCTFCEALCHQIMFGTPSLVNICIAVEEDTFFDCPKFLTMGNWPKLRRLSWEGSVNLYPLDTLSDDSKVGITTSFFKRHPLLECLSIDDMYSLPPIAVEAFSQRTAFPSLRSFRFSCSWMHPIAFMDQLHHITGLHHFPTPTFHQLVSLRSCTVDTKDIRIILSLLDAVPQLERLHVSYFGARACHCSEQNHAFANQCRCHEENLRTIICRFSNLTHLSLLWPEDLEISDITDFRDIIRHLPKLGYLQFMENFYFIGKAADNSITYQRLKRTDHNINQYHNWGDFYSSYDN